MKLEFEPQSESLPMVDPSHLDESSFNSSSPEVSQMLSSGIEAAQSGDRAEARNLLLRVTDEDPDNESAWLWLASISDYPEELLVFLNNVLRVNPDNERAQDWAKSTRVLLAKNFVQAGAEAAENGMHDFARQCFMQAIAHDDKNSSAWLWLASFAPSDDEKRSHLGRVLRIDPVNESALSQMKDFQDRDAKARLLDANRLAIAGGREEAVTLLDEVLADNPEMEDGWMLKAHLSESFEDKIKCFEKVLELNEENQVARANLDSLKVFVNSAPVDGDSANSSDELAEMQSEFYSSGTNWSGNGEGLQHLELEEVEEAEEEFHAAEPAEEFGPEEVELQAPESDFSEEVEEYEFDSAVSEVPADYPEVEDPDLEAIEQPESAEAFSVPEAESETREFFPVEEDEFLGSEPVSQDSPATLECPFCHDSIESQAFICGNCQAVLTLSDLELLLSNSLTDSTVVEEAVKEMELDQNVRGVVDDEMRSLGLGYINLKQYRKGFEYIQEYAAKNSGDVVLRSQVDALALRVAEIEQQESDKLAQPTAKTILIVDDSPTIRKLISLKLQKCGHETVCAIDGVDALEKINELVPDLVLLDITMPRMDGYQTCKLIRSNEATKDVPVVMISGKDGFFDKVRGKMAGTSNYITKPFGPETLMRTVNEYLM
jgi:twitching motility two-component system response regulator PilG